MSHPTQEQISILRWLSFAALAALFVSDYFFDAWAKPVPQFAYGLILAVAIGIDVGTLRDLFLAFLQGKSKNDSSD